VGVELVGLNGPASDAEVVSVLVDALTAAGLREFTVGVGTVAVLLALIDAAGGDGDWREQVLTAAHRGDLVGLERLTRLTGIEPAAGAALRAVPRIGGGADAIVRCREVVAPAGCAGALDGLAETWRLLEETGVAPRVRIDFGIMRSFDYYTGLIVEAYAPGLGVSLGGGGRYDDVLATFGAPMPAAGFALSLERVRIALQEQGVEPVLTALDAVVGGADAAEVLRAAAGLRARGMRVRVAPGAVATQIADEAARNGAAKAILAREGRLLVLGADGRETGEVA
jgi:ATP phosphoribosyltransferase